MSIRFDLESMPGVAIGVAQGALTLAEIQASAVEMWRRVEGPELRILWDLREAEFDLSRDEVRALAEFISRGSPRDRPLRTAFVVGGDFAFGLVRMFEMLRDPTGARTAVFRARESALEWLVGDAEPAPPEPDR